jgi:hypothetical protein
MLSMDLVSTLEASVLIDMVKAGNEYVTAAFELYQAGINIYIYMNICILI